MPITRSAQKDKPRALRPRARQALSSVVSAENRKKQHANVDGAEGPNKAETVDWKARALAAEGRALAAEAKLASADLAKQAELELLKQAGILIAEAKLAANDVATCSEVHSLKHQLETQKKVHTDYKIKVATSTRYRKNPDSDAYKEWYCLNKAQPTRMQRHVVLKEAFTSLLGQMRLLVLAAPATVDDDEEGEDEDEDEDEAQADEPNSNTITSSKATTAIRTAVAVVTAGNVVPATTHDTDAGSTPGEHVMEYALLRDARAKSQLNVLRANKAAREKEDNDLHDHVRALEDGLSAGVEVLEVETVQTVHEDVRAAAQDVSTTTALKTMPATHHDASLFDMNTLIADKKAARAARAAAQMDGLHKQKAARHAAAAAAFAAAHDLEAARQAADELDAALEDADVEVLNTAVIQRPWWDCRNVDKKSALATLSGKRGGAFVIRRTDKGFAALALVTPQLSLYQRVIVKTSNGADNDGTMALMNCKLHFSGTDDVAMLHKLIEHYSTVTNSELPCLLDSGMGVAGLYQYLKNERCNPDHLFK